MDKKTVSRLVSGAKVAALSLPALVVGGSAFAQSNANDFFKNPTANGAPITANAIGLSGGKTDLVSSITSLIQTFMGFLGLIAVVLILFGGFKWMTAAGSDEKVKSAKKIMYQGAIGLVIILAAWAIATFVLGQIIKSVG